MEITRDTLKKYGKLAGIGVVGAGLGAGAFSQADTGPTDDEYENLEEKVSDLNEENSDLQEELDARPTQEVVDNLETTIQEKNDKIDSLFTQDEVNDAVADATEREGLIDYLPVVVDEDVELKKAHAEADTSVDNEALEHGTNEDIQLEDEEGEEFDEVSVKYVHDDGHEYRATVRTFEDSEDADAYEEAVRESVEDSDYDEDLAQDAEVVRDGDTVVYLYGNAQNINSEYDSYDFDAVASQY